MMLCPASPALFPDEDISGLNRSQANQVTTVYLDPRVTGVTS